MSICMGQVWITPNNDFIRTNFSIELFVLIYDFIFAKFRYRPSDPSVSMLEFVL